MGNSLVRLLGLLLLTLLASRSVTAGETGSIEWADSFEIALEQAQFEDRPVMIDFYATWCGWCRKLERETFVDPRVVERSRQIVSVRINGPERIDLLNRYRVGAYPTLVFLEPDGRMIESQRGFVTADRFVQLYDRTLEAEGNAFILTQRLRDHPELIGPREELARLLLRHGETGRALAHLDTLLTYAQQIAQADLESIRVDRARALFRSARFSEAKEEIDRCVREDRSHPRRQLLFLQAEILHSLGETTEAERLYRELIQDQSEGWITQQCQRRLGNAG